MAVRQCPKCELRFANAGDLRSHLESDHGVEPEQLDHLQPPSARAGLGGNPPDGGASDGA